MPASLPRATVAPRIPPAARRVTAVAALLAVAAIGVRARGSFSSVGRAGAFAAAGRVFTGGFAAAEGAGLAACAVLLVLIFRGRRRKRNPEDDLLVYVEPQFAWWARPLALLFALAVLAVPFVLLALLAHGHPHGTGALPPPPADRPAGAGSATHGSAGTPPWAFAAGIAAVAAAALGLAVSGRRRSAVSSPEPTAPASAPARSGLAAALSAGTAALRARDDPRAAIIACYAAMERSFGRAGSSPSAADTPAEVLARASARGLVRSGAAGTLTALFRRARYSHHALAEDDRAAALGALAVLRADLRDGGRPDDAGDEA
jgi:hypothetical protein